MKQVAVKQNNYVTKEILEKKLEEKLEKKLGEHFTKFQDNVINNLQKHLDLQMQWWANNIKEDVHNKITQFKDQMLTTFDPLLQELETRRQDRELASYHTEKVDKRLDNHEKRITALEHI